MAATGFALFETSVGPCGIAWGPKGIVGMQLPEGREDNARARFRHRFPDAEEMPPPADIQHVVDDVVLLLKGEPIDLSAVPLNMDGVPDFNRRVYEIARTIPPGETLTYGEIAARLGDKLLARDVGQALGKNPFPIVVPCHRVLAAGGKTGGFSARGGVETKMRLLTIEKARTSDAPMLFDSLPAASPGPKGRRI